jgi:hypothetical protein
MFGADDYIVLGELCSQLAFACSTPSLSKALMGLAAHYLAQSHEAQSHELSTPEQQLQPKPDPLGFGD